LNTAGLLAGIEKYSGNLIYKRSSSPKFQVHNTALISAQSGELFKDILIRPDDWGRWVESSIGAYLINCSIIEGFTVSYWRERNQEVDFVLEKKGKVIGLEVKSGARQASSGISEFKKAFNPDKIILIGTSGIPWQDFLKLNPAQLF
jgi:predicted AAA+ superfamily ATPase